MQTTPPIHEGAIARQQISSEIPEQQPSADLLGALLSGLATLRQRFAVIKYGLLAGIVLSLLLCFFLPATYTGTVKILQPHEQQSIATLMISQLGPLAGFAGAPSLGKGESDKFVAILKSRTLGTAIVNRFDLQRRYGQKTLEGTLERLQKNTQINLEKDFTIKIEFDDKDASMAAAIANGYAEELDRITQTLDVSEASQQREYFEKQLRIAKDNLTGSELALSKTEETTGIIQPDSQAKAMIETDSKLRAQIAAKEVEIASMASFATGRNSDLARMRTELSALKTQLARIETGAGREGLGLSVRSVPKVGLEYERRLRDVKYYEAIFELLSKQYVGAKLDESKDMPRLQVLDKAVIPERRSKPNRLLIVFVVMAASILVSILLVFLIETLHVVRTSPAYSTRFEEVVRGRIRLTGEDRT